MQTYNKEYCSNNKVEISKSKAENYQRNKEQVLERTKQYRLEHKEQIQEYKKQYREKNRDKIKEQRQEFFKERIKCPICGSEVLKYQIARHRRSKKCQSNISAECEIKH